MINVRPNINLAGSYTSTQAARLLEIDRKTLYNHARDGSVKFTLNRMAQKRFKGSELMRYWASMML